MEMANGALVYFRTGSHTLFRDSPTWFCSRAEAEEVAAKMGFAVEDRSEGYRG
jgi:hypothetical protein